MYLFATRSRKDIFLKHNQQVTVAGVVVDHKEPQHWNTAAAGSENNDPAQGTLHTADQGSHVNAPLRQSKRCSQNGSASSKGSLPAAQPSPAGQPRAPRSATSRRAGAAALLAPLGSAGALPRRCRCSYVPQCTYILAASYIAVRLKHEARTKNLSLQHIPPPFAVFSAEPPHLSMLPRAFFGVRYDLGLHLCFCQIKVASLSSVRT